MNLIIELDSTLLIEKSKEIWKECQKSPIEFPHGLALIETIPKQEVDIPWLSGEVRGIGLSPDSACPIHTDFHNDITLYTRSVNILVESDGDNHCTRYYKYKEGEWDPYKTLGVYEEDPAKLDKIFEYTLKDKPTIFYNQILHDVYNYGNKRRILIMWLIRREITDEDIFNWCEQNNVKYKILYEV
jgi:hypothetical protein